MAINPGLSCPETFTRRISPEPESATRHSPVTHPQRGHSFVLTLPPLAQIVKRARSEPWAFGWVSLASFLAATLAVVALLGHALTDRASARMDRLGGTLAEMTAYLGLPAVLQQDRIALGNLVNRVAAFDEVVGCSVYTVDGRTLAFAGGESAAPGTRHYTAAIAVEDTLAGYARVVLDRDRFDIGTADFLAASWPLAPAGLAVAGLMTLLRRRAMRSVPEPTTAASPTNARFVLVANLFNHGSLRDMRRKSVLAHALEQAAAIADGHAGRARALPGARILIAFDDRPDGERSFEVLSAAMAFGQTLDQSRPGGHAPPAPNFRFGLHLGEEPDEAGAAESACVSDAVLLSALAPDGRLAISQDVFERIERPERLDLDTASDLSQAALTGTTLGRCRIVRAVRPEPGPAEVTSRPA